jgi:hypothetical protein
MTPHIEEFLNNFLTQEEKIARVKQHITQAKKEMEDWEKAIIELTTTNKEEDFNV